MAKRLRDGEVELATEHKDAADDWQEGLANECPPRYKDANGVPFDETLCWLDTRFVKALWDGEFELAFNVARLFKARVSELEADDDGDNFNTQSLMWPSGDERASETDTDNLNREGHTTRGADDPGPVPR